MTTIQPATVYTGEWTDFSYGSILGKRVTMSSRHAAVLIAFIAIFDGLVGNIFWNLLSFLIHQQKARQNRPRDGLHHQLQSLLRNSNEPWAFVQNAAYSAWRWRKIYPRSLYRVSPLVILAIANSLLFAAAGVLSSQIANTGNVLLTSGACGFYGSPDYNTVAGRIAGLYLGAQYAAYNREALGYMQSCYSNSLQNQSLFEATHYSAGANCDFYVRQVLNWTTTIGNPCPFADPTVCSVPDSEVIKMDTGLLDSVEDLGMNMQPEHRVLFRRVETCSPLTTTGFSNNSFSGRANISGDIVDVAVYSYGPQFALPFGFPLSANVTAEDNVTFVYPKSDYQFPDTAYSVAPVSVLSNPNISERLWFPDPRLTNDEYYPISLFFLANRASYLGEAVKDPWFTATDYSPGDPEEAAPEYWTNSLPVTVMGCVEQAQVCNPNGATPNCTDLNNWWTYDDETGTYLDDTIGLNPIQTAVAENLIAMMQQSTFYEIVGSLAQDTLAVSNAIGSPSYDTFSPPLPTNQWQIEVENWMAIANSLLQRYNLAQITGPTEQSALEYYVLYGSIEDPVDQSDSQIEIVKSLCTSQKVRNTAYQSFNVLGLAINFTFGGLIVLGGIITRYLAPYLQDRRKKSNDNRGIRGDAEDNNRRQAWIVDGTLQLQRMAYERMGLGDWEGDGSVPVTRTAELFRRPVLANLEAGTRDQSSDVEFLMTPLPATKGYVRV